MWGRTLKAIWYGKIVTGIGSSFAQARTCALNSSSAMAPAPETA